MEPVRSASNVRCGIVRRWRWFYGKLCSDILYDFEFIACFVSFFVCSIVELISCLVCLPLFAVIEPKPMLEKKKNARNNCRIKYIQKDYLSKSST